MRPIPGAKASNSNGTGNHVADEMFPEGGQCMDFEESPGTAMMDLTANDKYVHTDFFNNFGDLFDEDLLGWPWQRMACTSRRILPFWGPPRVNQQAAFFTTQQTIFSHTNSCWCKPTIKPEDLVAFYTWTVVSFLLFSLQKSLIFSAGPLETFLAVFQFSRHSLLNCPPVSCFGGACAFVFGCCQSPSSGE